MLGGALLATAGCESTNTPSGTEAHQTNASQSAPYAPGTGVGSSSFDRHPRFYTGDEANPASAAPTTQPTGGQ
jgi:hypothetical protein